MSNRTRSLPGIPRLITRELCQEIIEAQGHIVIACHFDYQPGHVLDSIASSDSDEEPIPGPVVVTGPATAGEFWEQARRFGLTGILPRGLKYFSRVRAE